MSTTKPLCKSVAPWLKQNGFALGGLTGQDVPALKSAVHIVELWCYADDDGRQHAAVAFGAVVQAMQPNLRVLAFHSIAHVGDWGRRSVLWAQAGLGPLENVGRCKFE